MTKYQLNRLFHPKSSRSLVVAVDHAHFLGSLRSIPQSREIKYAGFQLDTITGEGRLAAERFGV